MTIIEQHQPRPAPTSSSTVDLVPRHPQGHPRRAVRRRPVAAGRLDPATATGRMRPRRPRRQHGRPPRDPRRARGHARPAGDRAALPDLAEQHRASTTPRSRPAGRPRRTWPRVGRRRVGGRPARPHAPPLPRARLVHQRLPRAPGPRGARRHARARRGDRCRGDRWRSTRRSSPASRPTRWRSRSRSCCRR